MENPSEISDWDDVRAVLSRLGMKEPRFGDLMTMGTFFTCVDLLLRRIEKLEDRLSQLEPP